MSLRNGVPEMASRRAAGSKASRIDVAPRPVVGGVVDLVEDHERVGGQLPQHRGAGRHLLVGGDDAVHVRRQPAVGGRPRRVEVEGEAGGGLGPLHLEVGGRAPPRRAGARPLGQARGGRR